MMESFWTLLGRTLGWSGAMDPRGRKVEGRMSWNDAAPPVTISDVQRDV
jgi:hypothetical protein